MRRSPVTGFSIVCPVRIISVDLLGSRWCSSCSLRQRGRPGKLDNPPICGGGPASFPCGKPHPVGRGRKLNFAAVAVETRARAEDAQPLRPTRTIARLWQDAVAQDRQTPAYLVQDGDTWREISWQEAAQTVEELAHGLLALGGRQGGALARV